MRYDSEFGPIRRVDASYFNDLAMLSRFRRMFRLEVYHLAVREPRIIANGNERETDETLKRTTVFAMPAEGATNS